jgi:integrase
MLPHHREKITWQDAIADFTADRVDLSRQTLGNYTRFFHHFRSVITVDFLLVGRMHLIRYLQRYDHAPSYNTELSKVAGFFGWASDFYNIPNPAAKLRQKKVIDEPKPYILSDADYARIVASKGKHRDRCVFLANTGLRAAEFCNMQVVGHTVSVLGKGGKRRTVPLNQTALELIPRLKLVKSICSLYGSISRFGVKIGLPKLHPHSLRHYFATRLVKQQANIADVAKLLGHSDIKVTIAYYYHPDELDSVVKLLDEQPPL